MCRRESEEEYWEEELAKLQDAFLPDQGFPQDLIGSEELLRVRVKGCGSGPLTDDDGAGHTGQGAGGREAG